MRLTAMTLALLAAAAACGGDDAPKPKPKPAAAPAGGAPAAAAATSGGPQLVLRQKVDDKYRRAFTKEDFTSDPSGDVNRDPFYSYLVTPTAVTGGQTTAVQDECENRTVAGKYALGDLKLLGIIVRGTKNFAMFTNPERVGQIVYQGDCLAKDKARVLEITPSCVRVELRVEAPPGAPAPPAHEEKICLHPEEIEIQ